MAARWGVTVLKPYPDVYPGNAVFRCTLRDGTPAVIKSEPARSGDDAFPSGIDALTHYDGHGMVRVLEVARAERVILMELVVPGRPLWDVPIQESLEAIAAVMAKLRRAPPNPDTFPPVAVYHRAWPDHRLLYAGPGPVDADLFEIGAALRNRIEELYASSDPVQAMRSRVDVLADLTGFDRERVRLWALSQAVLSEVWSADDPSKPFHIDMRAARLLHSIGPLG